VLDWAASPTRRYREGENPARWRGHLDKELAKPSKIKNTRHHAALPYGQMSHFMQELSKRGGVTARCLAIIVSQTARPTTAGRR
jgi:hypothetical protein